MLAYVIDTMDWNNEFSFDKKFISSYGEKINKDFLLTENIFLITNIYLLSQTRKIDLL